MTQVLDTKATYKFASRGLGLSLDPCFICKEHPLGDGLGEGSCHENLAVFVDDKEDAEAIVAIFAELGCDVAMDYRDFEPNWVQIKLAACRAHQPSLRLLHEVAGTTGKIDQDMIAYCIPEARVPRDKR